MATTMTLWASSGPVIAPDNTKIAQGWALGEKPPAEYMNWWQQEMGSRLNHVLTVGVNDWHASINYPQNAYCRFGGDLYRAVNANTNSQPPSSVWQRITRSASALETGILPNGRISGAYTGFTNITASGTVTAAAFSGNGSALTQLNADRLSSGSIPNERLTGNYTSGINVLTVKANLHVGANVYTANTVNAAAFVGDGNGISGLNANNLAVGSVPNARLTGNYTQISNLVVLGNITANGRFVGTGSGLTALNASNLETGTVPNARLSGNYSNINVLTVNNNLHVVGVINGDGANITNMDASSLARGTVHVNRLPSSPAAGSWVGEQYAKLSPSAIGSIVFCRHTGSGVFNLGDLTNGPLLTPTNAEGHADGSSLPSGTRWECLGRIVESSEDNGRSTLWRRVS